VGVARSRFPSLRATTERSHSTRAVPAVRPLPDEPYGIDELAHDAADILDGRAANVVGLSMGGYVALTLALGAAGPRPVARAGRDRRRGPDACRVRKTFATPTPREPGCRSTSTDGG